MAKDDYDGGSGGFEAPDREPQLGAAPPAPAPAEAMAVYSADGQADDATGNDAGAEALRSQQSGAAEPDTDAMPHGPS